MLIRRIHLNKIGRDFIVGDIHGMFSALRALLILIGFDPEKDRLFCVGDLVSRGSESHEILDWLAKPWFFSPKGNHEEMVIAVARGSLPVGEHIKYGGEWFVNLTEEDRIRIVREFSLLPVVIELETTGGIVGIIHADCPVDDWAALDPYIHGKNQKAAVATCLWSTERYTRSYASQVKGVRAVVHGHMVVPQVLWLGNVLFIDTGSGYSKGRLTIISAETLLPV